MKQSTFELKPYLTKMAAKIDQALGKLLPGESIEPRTIHKAMRYSIFAGGKRIRPVLCLAACEAVRGKISAAVPLACAVECIHTYSLIHDDLPCMDNDDFRRGKPTSHKAFGEGIAVLAGDALLTHAFTLLATAPSSKPYSVATYVKELGFAAGSQRLIAGQVQDVEAENKKSSLDEVKIIHMNKTAALITSSVRLGAMAGGATPLQLKHLTQYGHNLGLAFQVIDDILDATSTKEIMGKSVRADQKNQKSTFPSVLGLEKSRQYASDLIESAHTNLKGFGKPAEPLRAIADYFLTRQN